MESPAISPVGAPDSPTQSTKYSLDLEALNLDDTGVLSSIPSPKVDKIASDEIDGPSDFTVNMSKWMKGNPKKRDKPWSFDALKEENNDATPVEGSAKDGAATDAANPGDETIAMDMTSDGTDNTDQDDDDDADRRQTVGARSYLSHTQAGSNAGNGFDADNTPQDVTEGSITPRQVEESSVWEPHHNSSSLRFSRPRSLLQPTVEDYNSDLTPARPHSAIPPPTFRVTPDPPRRAASASKLRPSSPGRPSSPTLLSPTRTPLPAKKENAPSVQPLEPQRPRVDREDARLIQEKVQVTIKSLRAQLADEQQRSDALSLELEQAQRRQHQVEEAAENARQHHQTELDRMADELDDAHRSEHDAHRTVDQRSKELEDAKRAEREASRLAEDRAKELDQMHESEDAELQDMRWQLQQAQDSDQDSRDRLAHLRRQMEEQGRAHDEEVQRLGRDLADARNNVHTANESERKAQDELRSIRQQRNEHATALRDETQRLRQELDEAQRQEEHARLEADRYYNELDELKSARESAQDTAAATDMANEESARRADDTRRSLEEQLSDAQAQIADITRACGAAHGAKEAADSERQKTQAHGKDLEVKLEQTQAELRTAEGALHIAEEVMQNTHQQGHSLQTKTEDRDAVTLRQNLERKLNQVQSQLATAVRERKLAEEAKAKVEEESAALKEELDLLQNFSRLDDDRPEDEDDKKPEAVPSKELEELNAGYDKALIEIERLKAQMRDAQIRHETQLKSELSKMETRHTSEQNAFRVKHKSRMSSVRARFSAQLITQKQVDAKVLADLRKEHSRTIDLIEEGMVALRADRSSLSAQVSTLKHDLERSQQLVESLKDIHDRASSTAEVSTLKQELDRAQKQIAAMKEDNKAFDTAVKKKAQDLMLRRDSLAPRSVEAIALEKDLEKAKKEIQSMKEVNDAFDEAMKDTINKREAKMRNKLKEMQLKEKTWDEKAAEFEKESKLMRKFILRQWGREECGTINNKGANKEIQKYVYQNKLPREPLGTLPVEQNKAT